MTPSDSSHRLELGCRAYAEGKFFLAHEHWEAVWTNTPREAPERASVQGLVQIAVALHKLGTGRPDVAHRLLDRALAKLDLTASEMLGIDLARVRLGTLAAIDVLRAREATPRTGVLHAPPVIPIAMTRSTE